MMQVSKSGKTLTINGQAIPFEQRVNEFVVLKDRVIVELYVDDFEVGDLLVGRNILAFDGKAELLWRIPATGVTRRSVLGGETPEAFFGLWLGDDGKVKTTTPNGFEVELDPDTGKISNPIFTAPVRDPERYGIVTFDGDGNVTDIEEKPIRPRSNQAVTGLYFFDPAVVEIAKGLARSARGETEITDVIRHYHRAGTLRAVKLSRGLAWLDTGTPDALLDASNYVATVERRQGMKVACLEEIAWRKGWIDADRVARIADGLGGVEYAEYLRAMLEG